MQSTLDTPCSPVARRPVPAVPRAAHPTVTVRRLTAAIGAEIDGLDLARDVLAGRPATRRHTVDLLRETIARHHMVVLRGQFLSARQHEQVAHLFGPIAASPVQLAVGGARRPGVSTIEDTPERPPAGFPWHPDVSWSPDAPRLGFLAAVTIPDYGGDTIWASTAAIYDRLAPAERALCDSLQVIHAPDAALLESVARHHGQDAAARLAARYPGTAQPLVTRHPVTSRRSLFLSPLYARRIVGPAGDDGRLLDRLHAELDDPEVQVRWRWRDGDFVIWDETATCHRALTDHHPQRRVMRRCTTTRRR